MILALDVGRHWRSVFISSFYKVLDDSTRFVALIREIQMRGWRWMGYLERARFENEVVRFGTKDCEK